MSIVTPGNEITPLLADSVRFPLRTPACLLVRAMVTGPLAKPVARLP